MMPATRSRFGADAAKLRSTRLAGRSKRSSPTVVTRPGLAAPVADQAHLAHEPLDGATRDADPFVMSVGTAGWSGLVTGRMWGQAGLAG